MDLDYTNNSPFHSPSGSPRGRFYHSKLNGIQ